MKIGPLESKPKTTEVQVAERKPGVSTTAKPEEASAQVELSSAAGAIESGGDGSFDAEKVKRIAQAIRDGKFEINPEAIADKLISNAQEVLSRTPR